MKKRMATIIVLSSMLISNFAAFEGEAASYSYDETTYVWNLAEDTGLTASADGVEYNGLTFYNGEFAYNSEDSESCGFITYEDVGYITYTPDSNGVLEIYAHLKTEKHGSYTSKGSVFMDSDHNKKTTSDNILSYTCGSAESVVKEAVLEAGKQYYIYNASSANAYIAQISFTPSDDVAATEQPTAEATQEPTSEPTAEPTPEPTTKPTNDPTVTLPPISMKPDFAVKYDYSDGELSGWKNPNGGLSVAEDTETGEKYVQMADITNTRGAYLPFGAESENITQYELEFDAKLDSGNKDKCQLAIGAVDYLMNPVDSEDPSEEWSKKRYNYDKGMEKNYILMLEAPAYSEEWTLNAKSDNVRITLPTEKFVHIKLAGYVPDNTAYLTITSGEEVLYDGPITPHSDRAIPQMMYIRAGRSYPVMAVDNIDFKAYYGMKAIATLKNEAEVGVTVAAYEDGVIYAALYDKDGKLHSIRKEAADGTAKTLKFALPGESGYKICLYKWSDDMEPLSAVSEAIEVDSIEAKTSDNMINMKYGYYGEPTSKDGSMEYSYGMPYRYYLPQNYDSEKSYPVVVYLHGAGSRGDDNKGQIRNDKHIFNTLLSEEYINNPDTQCIMIAPQVPVDKKYVDLGWGHGAYSYNDVEKTPQVSLVHDIILEVMEKYSVDEDRIYISGQSMGGYGCWYIAASYPELFAAAIGLCGAGPIDAEGAGKMAEVNMAAWAFHGTEDKTVPPSGSKKMIEALKAFGATNVHYTSMEGMAHSIEEDVFTGSGKEMGLYEWMFAQSKTKNITDAIK